MGTIEGTQVSELRDLIAQFAERDGDHQTSIASLCLVRRSSSTPQFKVLTPKLCMAAQGQMEVLLGQEVYSFVPGRHLVGSADLPVTARVVGATRSNPYLGLKLDLDLTCLRSLMVEAG